MIENEIYCYVNSFLKCNITKKSSYIVGSRKSFGKINILNLRNKRKSIFATLCILSKANSKLDLKIKESLHINWRKSNLNAQQSH